MFQTEAEYSAAALDRMIKWMCFLAQKDVKLLYKVAALTYLRENQGRYK